MVEQIQIDVLAKDAASEVLKSLGLNISDLGIEAAGVIGIFTTLAVAELELAKGAAEAAQEQARLGIALDNAGSKVGITTEELNKYSEELSRQIGIEDDVITRAQALAISFNLQGSQINRTVKAAADLSAFMGEDLVSSTQKLGRALQTFDGYTVLSRSLGKMNDAQKAQLESFKTSNDLIGYQNYLLDLLEGKMGGAAAAISNAGTGQDKLNVEMKIFTDNVGEVLLPEVQDLTRSLTDLLRVINENWQAVMQLWRGVEGLHRAMIAVSSLGLSELWRSVVRSGEKETGQPITHATGGSFTVPAAAGYEGYNLGGGHTASAGEVITVTQPGSSTHSVNVQNLYIGNTGGMGRNDIVAMIEEALNRVLE